jgi:hypothetical protein
LISNQIDSFNNIPTFGSLHTKSKSFSNSIYSIDSQSFNSNYLQSTVPNSSFKNINLINKKFLSPINNIKKEPISLLSPSNVNQLTLSDNKGSNNLNYNNDTYYHEDSIQSEVKK